MLGPWPGSSPSVSGSSLGMAPFTSFPLDIGTVSSDKLYQLQDVLNRYFGAENSEIVLNFWLEVGRLLAPFAR